MECKFYCKRCFNRFTTTAPKPVICPRCQHNYIEWINFKEVINDLVDQKLLPEYRRINLEGLVH